MTRAAVVCAALVCLGAEPLKTLYRAVQLDPGQRKSFQVRGMERVTGSSGRCVEEGMDNAEPETFYVEALCGGVRTSLVWLGDGTRYHVMACAEPEDRPAALVKTRRQVQAEVKAWPSVTACVRDGKVELWGWVMTVADKKKMTALEVKYGLDVLRDRVELIEE